jgi:hypothetical protein
LKNGLRILASVNLLLVPIWVLAWFGMASGIGGGGARDGYTFIYLIPLHVLLSIYSLSHYRLVQMRYVRDATALVLLIEQAVPPAYVLYLLLGRSMM